MCESFNLTSIYEKNLKPQAPPVQTTMEKFENAAFFLRLGLLSAVIRHKNGAFRKPALQTGGI